MKHDCLLKELTVKSNVAWHMIKSYPSNCYGVSGSSQLHLTVPIEMMCPEGFKLEEEVGPPPIIYMRMQNQARLKNCGRLLRFVLRKNRSLGLWTCSTHTRESCKTVDLKVARAGAS
jgi:hypothetical protein